MPDRLALIIANSRFDDPKLSRLVAPNKDAETLKRVLEDPAIGGFNVTMLVDESHTVIREEIARLYERKTRSDLLLLYYSGHGIKDDYGDLFLATRNTQTDLVSATTIEATFVRDRLNKSNSQRKVIILDCCHSGAFTSGAKAAMGSSVGTESAFAGSGYGWIILTASNAIEYAWEDSAQPVEARASIFTQYLVGGLESGAADLNADGKISLQELYDYTREQVLTSGRAKQTPLMWANRLEGQIIIAQNPHSDAFATLPTDLQQAIAHPQPWMREGAVGELARFLKNPNEALVAATRKALEQMRDDDSVRVRQAVATALSLKVSDVVPTIVAAPRKPAVELHPSLKITLVPDPAVVDVGTEVRWAVWLQNNGDDNLKRVTLYFGDTQKGEPFDLLVGRDKRFTLGRTYTAPGDKSERVSATGIASDGSTVQRECDAVVTVRPLAPELHPSIKVSLSVNPVAADAGEQVTWTMSVRNDGDDDLQQVTIYFDGKRKGDPFPLAAGKRRRFTFDRTYTTPGDKNEIVTAEGTASDGKSVRDTAQARVTIRQPSKPAQSEETLRDAVKAFANAHDAEQTIQCPVCDTDIKAKNLVRHFDKVHASDTSIDENNVRWKIEFATKRPDTEVPDIAEFLKLFGSATSTATRTSRSAASQDTTSRAHFKTLMDTNRPDALLECPICHATLQAKNLLWHYDRRHTENAPEPTSKVVDTNKLLGSLVGTRQEVNISTPVFLKLMRVPAGEFIMGSDPAKDKAAQPAEQPQHRVNLPEYYISEYPITNAQYEVFVKATGHDVPEHWKRLLLKPKIPSGTENTHVPNVSWHDAVAFCQWLSKETGKTFRLPTEAEWEKAARGTNGRITFQQPQQSLTDIMSWKRKSDSPYGCMDMMGGNLEWTRSLYWTYPYNANDGRENLRATGARVVRGQHGFQATINNKTLRYAERQGYEPAALPRSITFRVVMISK